MNASSIAKQLLSTMAVSALVAALPIFPSADMTRSQVMGHNGDVVTWEVGFASIYQQIAQLGYARPEEDRVLTICACVLLCVAVSFAIIKAAKGLIAARKRG